MFFSKTLLVTHKYEYLKQVSDIVSSMLDILGMEERCTKAVIKALILPTIFESWIHQVV